MSVSNILFALWFFLPVGIANCAPIFAAKMPYLKNMSYPLDGNQKINGKRILGDHKTIRGIVVGILASIATVMLEQYTYINSEWIRSFVFIDYASINPLLFGSLCALGALVADALKSFVKRQLRINPGKMWFPFDQLDYIIGGIIATYFYIPLPPMTYFLISMLWFVLHILASYIGHSIHLKQVPW